MVAFVERLLFETPDIIEVGENGHVNMMPYKIQALVESLRYGIGKHANQAQDTGRGDLIFQPSSRLARTPTPWTAGSRTRPSAAGSSRAGAPRRLRPSGRTPAAC